jgi:hypothetical protein
MEIIKGLSASARRELIEREIQQRIELRAFCIRFRECVHQLKRLQNWQKRVNDCGANY